MCNMLTNDGLCAGWSVLHCDWEHPHHHRRCCRQVQLWPAQPPLRPHTEGLVHHPSDSFIFMSCVSDCALCGFRAGRLRVIVWDRSFWVWLDGLAGKLALRRPQERYVQFCLSTKTKLKVGLWTCLAANSYSAEMWQPVINVELLKLVNVWTVMVFCLLK